MKKENYNKSTPSVSYTTAMNMLAAKLEIHSRATAKDADRALGEALVHARDAAHASVYSKLLTFRGRNIALETGEDIAQTVLLRMLDGKIRNLIDSNLPSLETAEDRKRWFGKVIAYMIFRAMRDNFRGLKYVSIEARDEITDAWKLVDFIDTISSPSLLPSDQAAMRESLQAMVAELGVQWQSSKASSKVIDWSPELEILGLTDETDRPPQAVLAKRTRERRQEEAGKIAKKWIKRINRPDLNEDPSL